MGAELLPDVFLSYQQRLMSSTSRYAVTVWEKSRRTGFSWTAAADAVLTAGATRQAGGMDVFYIGYNLEMAREFIDYVGEWATKLNTAVAEMEEVIFEDAERPEKSIKAFRVNFASGFKVLALPSVPRSLRGMQGYVIIDEAAFHDDLPGVLKAALALLMWGGKVLILSTHDGDANPFNVLCNDIRAGRLPYHLDRTTLNDALADGLYRRICLTSGKPWTPEGEAFWRSEIVSMYGTNADEELFCVPTAGSGAFLSAAVIEAAMRDNVPVVRWEPPAGFMTMTDNQRRIIVEAFCRAELEPLLDRMDRKCPSVFGRDFGRKRDLSVFWPMQIMRDMSLRTPFTLELRNVPYEAQRQIDFFIIERLPLFRAGKYDAGGNGGFLAEAAQLRFGERIEAVMLNETWYRENMPRMKAHFDDGTITAPRDRETSDDLRLIKLVRGVGRVPDERTGEVGKKRHGDAAIACALAVAASRAEPELYGYEGAPRELADESRGTGYFTTVEAANAADDEKGGGFIPELSRRIY